jgi:hypothetical protein
MGQRRAQQPSAFLAFGLDETDKQGHGVKVVREALLHGLDETMRIPRHSSTLPICRDKRPEYLHQIYARRKGQAIVYEHLHFCFKAHLIGRITKH